MPMRTCLCCNKKFRETGIRRHGPHGEKPVCCPCYNRYRQCKLPVYRDIRTKTLSLRPTRNSERMKIVGFMSYPTRHARKKKDMNRPMVERDVEKQEDDSKPAPIVIDLDGLEDEPKQASIAGPPQQKCRSHTESYNGSRIPVKASFEEKLWRNQVRRGISLESLKEILRYRFGIKREFRFSYVDEEGDKIEIMDGSDMKEMFRLVQESGMTLLRLHLKEA